MTQMKRYSTHPEVVEAVLVEEASLEELARLCGGAVGSDQDHTDNRGFRNFLRVPALGSDLKVEVGSYLVKDLSTNRYTSYTKAQFENKGFYEVGKRQDGIHGTYARGGQIRSPGQDEPQTMN